MGDTSVDLLPCPFCGGQPNVRRESGDERNAYANVVKVQCSACGVVISATGDTTKPGYADNSTTEVRAIAKWNRRAPVQRPAESGKAGA